MSGIVIINGAAIATGSYSTGSINSGRLLRTLPTSLPTFQAFISSAGFGLRRSTGKWDGPAGCGNRIVDTGADDGGDGGAPDGDQFCSSKGLIEPEVTD